MIPSVDERVLSREFDVADFSTPKPEAPWIKRCGFGIKFTDEIRYTEYSVSEAEPSPEKRKSPGEVSGQELDSHRVEIGKARNDASEDDEEEEDEEEEDEEDDEEEDEEDERLLLRRRKGGMMMGVSLSERVLKRREELCFSGDEVVHGPVVGGEVVASGNEMSIVNDSTIEIVEHVKRGLGEAHKAGLDNITLDLEKEEEEEATRGRKKPEGPAPESGKGSGGVKMNLFGRWEFEA